MLIVVTLTAGEDQSADQGSRAHETQHGPDACGGALLLLGLRLDEPVVLADVIDAVDRDALKRLAGLDLVELSANGRGEELRLTRRGRFLGGGVTADLLV